MYVLLKTAICWWFLHGFAFFGSFRLKKFWAPLSLLKYSVRAVITLLVYLTKMSFTMNISTIIFEKLKKMLKKLTLPILDQNISAHRFLPDLQSVAVNSKYSLISHIFELGIFKHVQKRDPKIYFPHSGPIGCQPATNIFSLENEFAKGKIFWNLVMNLYCII